MPPSPEESYPSHLQSPLGDTPAGEFIRQIVVLKPCVPGTRRGNPYNCRTTLT
jgi:hypothetical protein